jgi:hypothetical protein
MLIFALCSCLGGGLAKHGVGSGTFRWLAIALGLSTSSEWVVGNNRKWA